MPKSPLIPDDLPAISDEYPRIWQRIRDLHKEMHELVRDQDLLACARQLGMLQRDQGKNVMILEAEDEVDILWDYLYYTYRRRGLSYIQQFKRQNRYPPDSVEQRLLTAMSQARFSLFMVVKPVGPSGFIGREIYTGDDYFILDLSIPRQKAKKVLAGLRIFPWRGVWMHTGAAMFLGKVQWPKRIPFDPPDGMPRSEKEVYREVMDRWRTLMRAWGG